ncbi:Na(+)-translocating NADH-quinone reductase subunit C [Symmachiella macrocystis]|uniref:Na(+)-translocating NADH-quinone reductase subunit C n=1 Tax=Symmachiella macrocystis TaxID=2527985 RepID=A0A5C6BLL1_9PLAN|nr:Na(+)-translocating NADH-quinone reductase subunit C [Symmachiella macrocystis]TWU12351.1 Na(+)-translocating NADH-quinone reductase subunit C [Symmachiella macrocystis]
MQRNSFVFTFLVATVLCVVCSAIVSTAAVILQPRQERNKELDRKSNILRVAGLLGADEASDGAKIDELFKQIETKIVNLETGEYVTDIDVDSFDQRDAADDPEQSVPIPPEEDVASLKRREKLSAVYLLNQDGKLKTLILPVYTKGLWSTMYGFLAFEGDLRTVQGLGFYQHGETPGLGGEVDNPKWKEQWEGKLAYDDDGHIALHLIKGTVDPSSPEAAFQIDGLSGATITSRGVTNLIDYWLGPDGFGPYLEKMKSGGGNDGK